MKFHALRSVGRKIFQTAKTLLCFSFSLKSGHTKHIFRLTVMVRLRNVKHAQVLNFLLKYLSKIIQT